MFRSLIYLCSFLLYRSGLEPAFHQKNLENRSATVEKEGQMWCSVTEIHGGIKGRYKALGS